MLNSVEGFGTQDSRLDLPPIMMRGRGVNRWEHLPANPQSNVMAPFDMNTSSRIVAKDQYRPVGTFLPGYATNQEPFAVRDTNHAPSGPAIPTFGKINEPCMNGQCFQNWNAGIVEQEPCTEGNCTRKFLDATDPYFE